MQSTPCQQKPPKPAVGLTHSLPDSPKTSQHKGSQKNRPQRNCPHHSIPEPRSCHPPNRMIHWGPCVSRWTKGHCTNRLKCSSAQYHLWVCNLLAQEVYPLGRLLELEGTGGSIILYLGYVEVNLQIPSVKSYNEDILLLVIPTTTYSKKVPVIVGSKIINQVMGMLTKGEPVRQLWPGDRLTLMHLCLDFSSCPTQLQRKTERWGRRSLPHQAPILQHSGGSAWMMFRDQFVPLRKLQFPH